MEVGTWSADTEMEVASGANILTSGSAASTEAEQEWDNPVGERAWPPSWPKADLSGATPNVSWGANQNPGGRAYLGGTANQNTGQLSGWGEQANHSAEWIQNTSNISFGSSFNQTGEDFIDEGCFVEEAQAQNAAESTPSEQFSNRISMAEYNKQTSEYTKAALEALVSSREYQRRHTTCQLCWHAWSENQFTEACVECGGFAMIRTCPICDGKCGAIWKRDVEMSHSQHEAHWEGECRLPWEQRQGYIQQALMDSNIDTEDALVGMQDLSTS